LAFGDNRTIYETQKDENGKEFDDSQITSAHEFGHLMGLEHINGKGNDPDNYGKTKEQKMNIMGGGLWVTKANGALFLSILKRFGKDYFLDQRLNVWT
jgi:hypothetical protein